MFPSAEKITSNPVFQYLKVPPKFTARKKKQKVKTNKQKEFCYQDVKRMKNKGTTKISATSLSNFKVQDLRTAQI